MCVKFVKYETYPDPYIWERHLLYIGVYFLSFTMGFNEEGFRFIIIQKLPWSSCPEFVRSYCTLIFWRTSDVTTECNIFMHEKMNTWSCVGRVWPWYRNICHLWTYIYIYNHSQQFSHNLEISLNMLSVNFEQE